MAEVPGRSALHGRRVFLRSGVAWLACLYQWSEAWRGCVRGRRRGSDECGWQPERRLGEAAASQLEKGMGKTEQSSLR